MENGWKIIRLKKTTSTNDEIKALPVADKTAVVAETQTGGRGRSGRRWVSPAGNLYMSLGIEPVALKDAAAYSFLTAVALAEAIEQTAAGLKIKCKWPNDLLADGKKISGILLETDGMQRLIVGVGVNIVPVDCDRPVYPATSLSELGYSVEIDTLSEVFLTRFSEWKKTTEQNGCGVLFDAWKTRAFGIGGAISVRLPDQTIHGTFEGLDTFGRLLLNDNGKILNITAGDVFFGDKGK